MPLAKCFSQDCVEEGKKECLICNRPFCEAHASKEDPEYCSDCCNPTTTEMKETKPLVDEEGVAHEGRELTPVGKYFISSAGSIANMSDDELDRFRNQYARKVHELEALTDYNRVMLSMTTMEAEERFRNRSRSLRGKGLVLNAANGTKVTVNSRTKDVVSTVANALVNGGTDLGKLESLLSEILATRKSTK